MGITFKKIAINLAFYCLGVAAQGKCDHYLDKNCVDAYGSKTFDFQPLFSEQPRFGYGFRVYQSGEISDSLSGRPSGYRGDTNEIKAWLEWKNGTILIDPKANKTSDFALIFTNSTNQISGGNNGCDGLLGETCVKNLKDILKWAVVLAGRDTIHIFRENVQKFQQTPLTNLSCPGNIFNNFQDFNYIRNFDVTPGNFYVAPTDSGNATYPWITDLIYQSAEAQMAFSAVGVVTRFNTEGATPYEDVQLELVCVRPEPAEGSGDRINVTAVTTATGTSPTGSSSPKNGATGLEITHYLLGIIAAITVVSVL